MPPAPHRALRPLRRIGLALRVRGPFAWGDPGGAAVGVSIGRANLDGSNVDHSFITGAAAPCGFAFDH